MVLYGALIFCQSARPQFEEAAAVEGSATKRVLVTYKSPTKTNQYQFKSTLQYIEIIFTALINVRQPVLKEKPSTD